MSHTEGLIEISKTIMEKSGIARISFGDKAWSHPTGGSRPPTWRGGPTAYSVGRSSMVVIPAERAASEKRRTMEATGSTLRIPATLLPACQ